MTRRGELLAAAALVALLFFAVRVVLLVVRQPFYDEVFTTWMAHQPFASIIPRLLQDSGPPLYYFIARLKSVFALRWMSLVFAAVPLVLILAHRSIGNARFLAAALLAVYPPAVMYATEGRAYALCGMLVAIGVLLLDEDDVVRSSFFVLRDDSRTGRRSPKNEQRTTKNAFAASLAFVLAAYSHYYGVLFFPVLLTKRRGVWAFVVAAVLFAPGAYLAFQQPAEALAWNTGQRWWAPLVNLSFAGMYPPAIFTAIPLWLVVVAMITLLISLAGSWRFAPAVLMPIALVIAFSLAGRPIYFPMRFESVVSVPLVLWISCSLDRRRALAALLMTCGLVALFLAVRDHRQRPLDPCTRAAMRLRGQTVVAADYCYLMAWPVLGDRVIAFPPEQAEHPGWRRNIDMEAALAAARSLPREGFFYIGHELLPEVAAVRQVRRVQLIEEERLVVAMWVAPEAGLTSTLH